MISPVVRGILERAGLLPILEARIAGDSTRAAAALGSATDALAQADLFAVGALADALRAQEVGPVIRVHTASALPPDVRVVSADGRDGLGLLREVALARITAPPGARVAVDFAASGIEIAEVALAFGASELSGAIAKKRGLAIASDERRRVKGQGMVSAALLKQNEMARVLGASGRDVVFEGGSR